MDIKKIVIGPYNFAGQASYLAKELKKNNFDIIEAYIKFDRSITKDQFDKQNVIDENSDFICNPRFLTSCQLSLIDKIISAEPDLINLWHRPYLYSKAKNLLPYSGLDLAIFKNSNIKVVSRFTGYDIRDRVKELDTNPYSPIRYGWKSPFSRDQINLSKFMIENSDACFVTDEEMCSYIENYKPYIIPRLQNPIIDENYFNKIEDTLDKKKFRIVHAPSDTNIKGTKFIREAINQVQKKLNIEYVELVNKPNKEVLDNIKGADLVIDQMHVGWYGVLTLEALSVGCPSVCYIRPDLKSKFKNTPIILSNINNLSNDIMEYLSSSKDFKLNKHMSTINYLKENHSTEIVLDKYKLMLKNISKTHSNTKFKLEIFSDEWINFEKLKKERFKKKFLRNFKIKLPYVYNLLRKLYWFIK